jgi:RpiR family transcriptional regulator, carbohydrate utilization regulator
MKNDNPPIRDGSSDNILEVVRRTYADLRRSDKKVADALLADPRRIMSASVAETAEIAGVSQPTVIRFSSAVGCSGFQDLKLRLAQAVALGTPATRSVLLDTNTPGELAEKIFDYTITSLDWARNRLDLDALEAAIALLLRARSIEFFGFGASAIVARDAQQKFPLFDVPCGAQLDSHMQIMVASMMQPDDVAVLISNTGMTRSIIELARTVRESGAKTICITGSDSPLVRYSNVTLIVETLDNTDIYTPTISRIAALVVVDLLSTAVALRRDKEHARRFSLMKRRLNDFRFNQVL